MSIDTDRRDLLVQSLKKDLAGYYGAWNGDSSPKRVAATILQESIFNKWAPDNKPTAEADMAALNKFLQINNGVDFVPPHGDDTWFEGEALGFFKDEMYRLFEPMDGVASPTLNDLANHWAPGPGSSRLADSRNFYSKFFDSDWSYTNPFVLQYFTALVSGSTTWTSAIAEWSKKFRPVQVEGNTFFTVLKKEEISRTCCTEALLNMCIQKAIGSWIEKDCLLRRHKIDLARQPDFNRELCRRGSIDSSYGTIDSTSASDSIATSLCTWSIQNKTLLGLILATRSETSRLPDGSVVKLRMVSTMGNGFTFPLETAIFSCAVRAVYRMKGLTPLCGDPATGANYGVFGDDIVCLTETFDAVTKLLVRLGFLVNEEKSFNTGPFRESCGFDYFNGFNVRPIYVKRLRLSQDVYKTFNRLARWSAVNRIPLVRTLSMLQAWTRMVVVPFSESDDAGFKVPASVLEGAKLNQFGHIRYKAYVPYGVETPVPFKRSDARKFGYRHFNAWGWELAFIGSYARTKRGHTLQPDSNSSAKKREKSKPEAVIFRRPFQGEVLPRRLRSRSIPFWDWVGPKDPRFPRESFQDWQVLVEATLRGS